MSDDLHVNLSICRCRRAFGNPHYYLSSTVCNSLPDHLCDPAVDSEQFRRNLKMYLFAKHSKC